MEAHPSGGDLTRLRLADVVEQPGQPQDQVGLAPLHDRVGVAEHILVLVDGILLELQGRQLRKEDVGEARIHQQR